jgi:hypothetical protein
MALGSTQPLLKMGTRNILGGKAAGAWGWQTHHLHVPNVMKSGSLNLLGHSGPHRACYGTPLRNVLGICTLISGSDKHIVWRNCHQGLHSLWSTHSWNMKHSNLEVWFHFLGIDVGLYSRLWRQKKVVIGLKAVAKIDLRRYLPLEKKNTVLLLFLSAYLTRCSG